MNETMEAITAAYRRGLRDGRLKALAEPTGRPAPDTSDAIVESMALQFDYEARHRPIAAAAGDKDHVAWCDWMLNTAKMLRALRDERNASLAAEQKTEKPSGH